MATDGTTATTPAPPPKPPLLFGRACWLGPWHAAPMDVQGRAYHHVEGWMQSQKHACNPQFAAHIRRAESASQARDMGAARELWADLDLGKRALTPHELADWDARKFDVLVTGLRAKFEQHPRLARRLAQTAGRDLVFDDPHPLWGRGADGTGANRLGVALMAVRARATRQDAAARPPLPPSGPPRYEPPRYEPPRYEPLRRGVGRSR
jgi:ribA/ribD-fused uncharacterized protein